MPDFVSLGISESIINKLKSYGVVNATPIQEKAIPFVMQGRDVIAQAQTGTGKTFAFILPILEKINPLASHVQALIVTPTRELALQITEEFQKLTNDMDGVDVLAVYGGQDVDKQLKKLKKNVQIVVGTPGRLLDHIGRGTVQLSEVSFLVLDEADQMLHIGFLKEVEDIIRETPKSRQTMLFSATMPEEIRTLANKHMRKPEYIQVEKNQGPAENVKLIAIHTIDRAKQATLIELVETHRPYLAVIFCRTKRRVSKLYEVLKSHKFLCDELHGDLSQAKREQVMKRFRDGEIQLLIATDVAARGLDVEGVTHVFNYDIPQDAESFIHRIGRTGRAGTKGVAITLYSSDDRPTLDMIEKELTITIQKQNIGNSESSQKNKQEPTKDQGKRYEKRRSSSGQGKDSKPKSSSRNESKPKSIKRKQTNSSQAGGGRNRKSSKSGLVKRSK
ncbi:DEAD/DEAH box helicase [Neobacillus sp. CF12]|uniref:DEAD/DEAH box helicase n=1 Tax=Neobacillus sp. CF12 TaxID=3055864 RepID=UPI0025A2228D|nr:DEAD/DEAH box helicase [Neobacillus sp. CF12]MDM5330606.1 DEAD/DEAH box helicase [Neobacillus sp. CF12]